MRTLLSAAVAALVLSGPAAAQEIQPAEGPDFLKILGDFVRDGLAPPRTAADLAREEEKARQAAVEAERAPKPPAPPETPGTPPAPPAIAVPAPPPPPPPPAEPVAAPAAVAAPAPPPPPAPAAEPVAAPVAAPAPRPKAIVVPRPAAEPISASDRIAGTATLDQAIKLGGPLELYTRRPPRPAPDPAATSAKDAPR